MYVVRSRRSDHLMFSDEAQLLRIQKGQKMLIKSFIIFIMGTGTPPRASPTTITRSMVRAEYCDGYIYCDR